jgi:hypothetical protein
MRVLVACEFSGVVRRAFRERGHDAYSCDLLPAEDGDYHHFESDVLDVIKYYDWDMMIAHPPCTYLCNSGVRWLKEKEGRWNDLVEAGNFFRELWFAPIPKIVIENPVPHKYAAIPKYNQTIQPYMFGDDASKRTCLWLKNVLPLVIPDGSKWVQPRIVDGKKRWANQTDSGQNRLGPSETRASERSRTYDGIARAFAEQWG